MPATRTPSSGGVRFAPSPTGRFHLGNLRTAWISWRWSRHLRVPWVVRFEDIDKPRVLAGAREGQLADLATIGLKPDLVFDQSSFHARHLELFAAATSARIVYPCDCSRKDVQTALAGLASAPHDGSTPVYSGRCRDLDPHRQLQASSVAWRFRMPKNSGRDDFIVARSGLESTHDSFTPSYHWACAIDDHDGEYDLLVRSWDLAPALPLQRAIQKWVGDFEKRVSMPPVFHTSLVVQNDGHRLEKRTRGVTLAELRLQPSEVIAAIEKSFDSSCLREPISDGGEPRPTLSLGSLDNRFT